MTRDSMMAVLRVPALRSDAVHVGAGHVPAVASPVAEPAERTREDGFRIGFDQGLAEGRREGREQGHRTGYDEGVAQARTHAAECLAAEVEQAREELETGLAAQRRQLVEAAEALSLQRRQCLERAEDDLVALGFDLACQVLGPELVSVEGVRAQARGLIEGRQGRLAIHVPPFLAEELAQVPSEGVRWIADTQVDAGVVVEHGSMRLDARLDVILARFKALLLQARCAAGADVDTEEQGLA